MPSFNQILTGSVEFAKGAASTAIPSAAVSYGLVKAAPVVARMAPRLAGAGAALMVPGLGHAVMLGGIVYTGYEIFNATRANAAEPSKADQARETPEQARARLGKEFGGTPNDLKLAADNDRANMAKAKTQQQRDAYERRALLAEQEYERRTGQHIGPTVPNAPSPPAHAPSMFERVFGEQKASPFDIRRQEIRAEIEREQKNADLEYKKSPGTGPNQRAHSEKLDKLRGELGKIDKEERDAPSSGKVFFALGQSFGAMAGGMVLGNWVGKAAINGVTATATKAVRESEALGTKALALIKASPKGVIARTVEGDRAAGVVHSFQAIKDRGIAAASYMTPALIAVQGAGAYALGQVSGDENVKIAARADAIVSGVAAIYGAKGVAAANLLARTLPTASAKAASAVKALATRVEREIKVGPAAVAQYRGRSLAAKAAGTVKIAEVKAKTEVAVAGHVSNAAVAVAERQGAARVVVAAQSATASGQVAAQRSKGRVAIARSGAEVAKQEGNRAAVKAAGLTGVERNRAATAVEKSNVVGKQSIERARAVTPISKYSDRWTVQRKSGVTYIATRHDTSVRGRRNGRVRPAKAVAAPIVRPARRAAND